MQHDDPWNAAAEGGERIDLTFYPTSLISRVASVLSQNHPAKEAGLTFPEWRLLGRLSETSPIQLSLLCRIAYFDKAQAGRVLRVLEKRNFVSVEIDPAHSSRRIVSITKEGSDFIEGAMPAALEKQIELLQHLTPEERRVMFRALCKLLEAMGGELPEDGEAYQGRSTSPKT